MHCVPATVALLVGSPGLALGLVTLGAFGAGEVWVLGHASLLFGCVSSLTVSWWYFSLATENHASAAQSLGFLVGGATGLAFDRWPAPAGVALSAGTLAVVGLVLLLAALRPQNSSR